MNPLSPIIDIVSGLPGWWIAVAVLLTVGLQQWNRMVGSVVGLGFCPLYALWGHEQYLRHKAVSLFGAVPLTEAGFYVVVGLLALYYFYYVWDFFNIKSRQKRLRQANKKWS